MYLAYLITFLSIFFGYATPLPAQYPNRPLSPPPRGIILIRAEMENAETMDINIKSLNGRSISAILTPTNGQINWQSEPLLPGSYEISFSLPKSYEPILPQKILLHTGERATLAPRLMLIPNIPSLHVDANIPEATFLLRLLKTAKIWKGEGSEYNFRNLPGGNYQLSFSSSQPDYYIPPQEKRFYLNENERKIIKAVFQIAVKITVKTNIERSHITIQEIGGQRQIYEEDLIGTTKAFTLPEGRYSFILSPLSNNKSPSSKLSSTNPVEIDVHALTSVELALPYIEKASPQSTPNPSQEKNTPSASSSIIEAVLVPAGKAIIGNATSEEYINERSAKIVTVKSFSIGIYEITNQQYASWLNQALNAGKITYVKEADNRGQILDLNGRLLFKTYIADNYSQISSQTQSMEGFTFLPIPGKDLYPVINVTWYGAMAFCADNHCRLPTEAEWEKAAGNVQNRKTDAPLKKYVYGFGSDTIDRTWANYKDDDRSLQYFRVLTTPVGFYNGINVLPLTATHAKQEMTHLAKSPYGAFDMSGNVWEWVADWYDDGYYASMSDHNPQGPPNGTLKVVKGGCYDSLADGIRVNERLGLLPDHADAYTGFRVVFDVEENVSPD